MSDRVIRAFMRLATSGGGGEGSALLASVLGVEGCTELRDVAQAALNTAALAGRRDPATDPRPGDLLWDEKENPTYRRVMELKGKKHIKVRYVSTHSLWSYTGNKGRWSTLENWTKACLQQKLTPRRLAEEPDLCHGGVGGRMTCRQEAAIHDRMVAAYEAISGGDHQPLWRHRALRPRNLCEACQHNVEAKHDEPELELTDFLRHRLETKCLEVEVEIRKCTWTPEHTQARAIVDAMRRELGLLEPAQVTKTPSE